MGAKNRKNLEGMRFGKLVVVGYAYTKNKRSYWNCTCDCGNEAVAMGHQLTGGQQVSCGCYKNSFIGDVTRTHGESRTRLYRIWAGIKERCFNENSPQFKDYGLRGITMCTEWVANYERFRSWAIINGYKGNLSIDRIDNNGSYCPENCRWATMKEQCNNKRSNLIFERNGEKKNLKQWADDMNLPYKAIHKRITHYGMSFEEAITKPLRVTK